MRSCLVLRVVIGAILPYLELDQTRTEDARLSRRIPFISEAESLVYIAALVSCATSRSTCQRVLSRTRTKTDS